MRPLKSKEKEKIVYLIAAFTVEDDKNEEQVLQHINDQIQSLQMDQKALQNNMMTEIKDMQIQQAKQMQLLYKIMKSKKIKSNWPPLIKFRNNNLKFNILTNFMGRFIIFFIISFHLIL